MGIARESRAGSAAGSSTFGSESVSLEGTEFHEAVLLVNNLGGSSDLEVSGVAYHAVEALQATGVVVRRAYVGRFMTSMDMKGFSLSVLPLSRVCGTDQDLDPEQVLEFLDSETSAPGWVRSVVISSDSTTDSESATAAEADPMDMDSELSTGGPASGSTSTVRGLSFARGVLGACSAMLDPGNTSKITDLDTLAGDGDCGDTMALAARCIGGYVSASVPEAGVNVGVATGDSDLEANQHGVRKVSFDSGSDALRAIGRVVQREVGGTTGIIYALMLGAAARHLAEHSDGSSWPSTDVIVAAAAAGVSEASKVGGAARGDSTLLDAAFAATDAAAEAVNKARGEGEDDDGVIARLALRAASSAALVGAEATARMLSAAGRASYVGEHSRGVVDAGAFALALWLQAAADAAQK